MEAGRHGCPYGVYDKWYCFYEHQNFGGRRLQFLEYYCPGTIHNRILELADWDFINQTTAWVNNSQRTIKVYDGNHATGYHLWTMGDEAESPYVGVANDRANSATVCA